MQVQSGRSPLQFFTSPWFVLPLFATLGLIGILNHEMWRDEMNTWLIVRDSSSLDEMLSYVNYQGHPALWALLVSLLRNVADTPVAMQILHWALGTGAMLLFWCHSPFSRGQKTLFTFGYLPFYEYFLISRPYVLGMVFIFLFCTLYPSRKKTYVWVALALGLMANSHAFAAIVSFAALVSLGIEFCTAKGQRSRYLQDSSSYDLAVSLFIVIVCYAFAFVILSPPADSVNAGGQAGWDLTLDMRHLLRVLGRLLGGYFLVIPNSSRWLDLIVCDVIGSAIFLLTAIRVYRHRVAFSFYCLATGGLLSFFYLRFLGHGTRHYGYLYLILVCTLWLAQYPHHSTKSDPGGMPSKGRSLPLNKLYQGLFTVMLIVHFGGGLYRFPADLAVPFSGGKDAATYILQANLVDEFIVASPDRNMAALSGYLGRQLYYPELEGMGSFTIFQAGRRTLVNHSDILRQVSRLLPTVETQSILLVLNKPIESQYTGVDLALITQFEESWHSGEKMYLYWARPKSALSTQLLW